MSMDTLQAGTGWTGSSPAFPHSSDGAHSSSTPAHCDGSVEERFEEQAMPHLGDLFRTALRMTGERAQAEDVIQEVYLQAWRSFDRFEPGTNCRSWLFKI